MKYLSKLLKAFFLLTLFLLFLLTRYYHSFFLRSGGGYGSGDGFGVITDAYLVKGFNLNTYFTAYFYSLVHHLIPVSWLTISYIVSPFFSLGIILGIFLLIKKEFGFLQAFFTSLWLILNPYLAYQSTEPSKEIFVLFFFIYSFYFLHLFIKNNEKIYLIIPAVIFGIGSFFYHSIYIYLPFLIFLLLIKNGSYAKIYFKKFFKTNLINIVIFLIIVLIISSPFYIAKEIIGSSELKQKPAILLTQKDTYGGIFISQFNAMIGALENPKYLGFDGLNQGIENYIDGKNQILILFGIVFVISFIEFSRRRRTTMGLEFSLLTVYSYMVVGSQWSASSQSSRYPQYMMYFLLTVSSLIFIYVFRLLSPKKNLLIIFVVLFLLFTFFASNPLKIVDISRNWYAGHTKIGYLLKNLGIQIDNNHKIMYLGWPSLSLSLLENYKLKTMDNLITFGWDSVNLTGLSSKKYIENNNIKYYIYTHSLQDYSKSSDIVLQNLKKNFLLRQIDLNNGNYIPVYKILEK